MTALHGVIPMSGISFYFVDQQGEPFGHVLEGLANDQLHDYRACFVRHDPLHPVHFAASGENVVTLETASLRVDAEFYVSAFLKSRDLHHEVEVFFRDAAGAIIAGAALFRRERDGRFRASEVELLLRVRPIFEFALRAQAVAPVEDEGRWLAEAYDLTPREIEVVKLLRRGAGNDQISKELDIRLSTVKTHVFNIFIKAGVSSRTELLSQLYLRAH